MKILSLILKFIIHIFYPPRCIICDCTMFRHVGLCNDCLKLYERAGRKKCGICLKQARNCSCRPILLTKTDSLGSKDLISLIYLAKPGSKSLEDKFTRKFIYHIKRDDNRAGVDVAARDLSREILLLLKAADENTGDWIITNPPRSKEQLLVYGFDHAAQIATEVSRLTGIKYISCFTRKTHKMQKTLNAMQRRANADKAYELTKDVSVNGKKVLIIDDVITTGATTNACANILKEKGAEIVFPMCIARTRKDPVSARRALTLTTWFASNKSKKKALK